MTVDDHSRTVADHSRVKSTLSIDKTSVDTSGAAWTLKTSGDEASPPRGSISGAMVPRGPAGQGQASASVALRGGIG